MSNMYILRCLRNGKAWCLLGNDLDAMKEIGLTLKLTGTVEYEGECDEYGYSFQPEEHVGSFLNGQYIDEHFGSLNEVFEPLESVEPKRLRDMGECAARRNSYWVRECGTNGRKLVKRTMNRVIRRKERQMVEEQME